MSNDDTLLGMSRSNRLRADVTFLMLKGAGFGLVFVLSIWLVIAVIAAIGRQLPEDSRSQADPTPLSFAAPADPVMVQVG